MLNKNNHISHLDWNRLAGYIANEPESANGINNEELYEAQFILDQLNRLSDDKSATFDTNKAWAKIEPKLDSPRKKPLKLLLSVAATIALLVVGYTAYLNFSNYNQSWTTTAENPFKTVTLNDGTVVDLNRHSTLAVSNKFGQQKREVQFTGKGYYSIASDAQKPFIIHTKQGAVEVLGTSFSVTTYNDSTEIYVSSGRVKVTTSKGDKQANFEPGERAILTSKTIQRHQQTDTNHLAWITKKLVFNDKSLSYVAGILEEVYGINITFSNPQLKQLMFTGTFENQPIEVIMENVKAVFGVKCHRKGNHFEIHINE